MNVTAIHCHVLADGTVIPDSGYEGAHTEHGPFRGKCAFDWVPGWKTEPHLVVAKPSTQRPAAVAPVIYWPVINWCVIDYAWWSYNYDTLAWEWTTEQRKILFGTNGEPAMPYNSFWTGVSGEVAGSSTGLADIESLAFTYFDPATLNAWETSRMRFFRWRGEAGNETAYPYGRNNVKRSGIATVEMDIWMKTYSDGAMGPVTVLSDVFSSTESVTIDASGGTVGNGVPSQVSFSGFTNAQIDTFAEASFVRTFDQTKYASNYLKDHFYPKTIRFSIA